MVGTEPVRYDKGEFGCRGFDLAFSIARPSSNDGLRVGDGQRIDPTKGCCHKSLPVERASA